eukprot:tig00021318_g20134.t1
MFVYLAIYSGPRDRASNNSTLPEYGSETAAAVTAAGGADAPTWQTPLTRLPPIAHPVADEASLPAWPQPVVFVDFREVAAGPSTFRLISEAVAAIGGTGTVVVRPGNYVEERPLRVHCSGDLAIVGDGFQVILRQSKVRPESGEPVMDFAGGPHALLVRGLDVRGGIELSGWCKGGSIAVQECIVDSVAFDPPTVRGTMPIRVGPFSRLEPAERAALARRQFEHSPDSSSQACPFLACRNLAIDILLRYYIIKPYMAQLSDAALQPSLLERLDVIDGRNATLERKASDLEEMAACLDERGADQEKRISRLEEFGELQASVRRLERALAQSSSASQQAADVAAERERRAAETVRRASMLSVLSAAVSLGVIFQLVRMRK